MNSKNPFVMNVQEEMTFYGVDCTPLQNLISIVTDCKDSAVCGVLAGQGIIRLSQLGEQELMELGLTKKQALRLVASMGLIPHYIKSKKEEREVVRSPEDAARVFWWIRDIPQEIFAVAFLNTKNQVLCKKEIFKGCLNSAVVHPREIFAEAIKLRSAAIVCCHQHPSGESQPSSQDIDVTKRLVEAGRILGIEVLEHIILGRNNYVSLKEKGYV